MIKYTIEYLKSQMSAEFIAISIVLLLFSVILHEVAHGFAALKFGDTTAQRAGRLTLNPIPHIDPFGTILLPLLLFISNSPILVGWAKPVPINPLNFSNIKKGELIVSLAGVGANYSLAILGAIFIHILSLFYAQQFIMDLLGYLIKINLVLTVFNLLPIPPLDGSKVIVSQLSLTSAREFLKLEKYSLIFFLMLFFIRIGNSSLFDIILRFGVNILKIPLGQ